MHYSRSYRNLKLDLGVLGMETGDEMMKERREGGHREPKAEKIWAAVGDRLGVGGYVDLHVGDHEIRLGTKEGG